MNKKGKGGAGLRGCEKRVIRIKSPPGSHFEEAYFILRSESNSEAEEDIVREAERLIAQGEEGTRRRFSFGLDELLFFGAGVFLTLLLCVSLWLILSYVNI